VTTESKFEGFLKQLEKSLQALPGYVQVAFAVACCDRHFENYVYFSRQQGWGNPEILREAINAAWLAFTKRDLAASNAIDLLLNECRKAVPDSEQFSTPLVGYAQDLAIMVVHCADFMRRNDPSLIVMIASPARDIVDAKVQDIEKLDPSDCDFERKISEYPLMQAELISQKRSLAMSEQTPNLKTV
jgi:uncharacterized protein YjaG (DUF416 family)